MARAEEAQPEQLPRPKYPGRPGLWSPGQAPASLPPWLLEEDSPKKWKNPFQPSVLFLLGSAGRDEWLSEFKWVKKDVETVG